MTPHDLNEEQIALAKQYTGDVEGLVAAASEASSPLHELFDWEGTDLSASEARRKAAEALIASVNEPVDQIEPADPANPAPEGAADGNSGEASTAAQGE